MGAKDSKGIWRYSEDDAPAAATFSELLNIGQASVSDRIAYFAGTTAERLALDPAPAGAMWQDTNDGEKLWSCAPDGKWRLHEGKATFAAGSWATATTNVYYRQQTVTIPTILAPNETVLVSFISTTGNSWLSVAAIQRNASDTVLTLRIMQIATAAVTIPGDIAWRVVKGA